MKTSDIAIVTGAARGIGASIADRLEAGGWRVVRIDLAIEATGPLTRRVDVTDFAGVASMVDDIETHVGPVRAVINNAGLTRDGFAHRMDPESQWAPVIAVNLTGPFNLCRAVLPQMRTRKSGRIVNMSSMNGLKGQAGQANYAASNAGLVAMTKCIALESASLGITANCIAPGFIDTDMTRAMRPYIRETELAKVPMGRPGSPEDIAQMVEFLLSSAAAFITGQTISVNGGQFMP